MKIPLLLAVCFVSAFFQAGNANAGCSEEDDSCRARVKQRLDSCADSCAGDNSCIVQKCWTESDDGWDRCREQERRCKQSSSSREVERPSRNASIGGFHTGCLVFIRSSNSFRNNCGYAVIEKTIVQNDAGWGTIGSARIDPGATGGHLMAQYSGRVHFFACRYSDVTANVNNQCVRAYRCMQALYQQRATSGSASAFLARCGISVGATRGG